MIYKEAPQEYTQLFRGALKSLIESIATTISVGLPLYT